MRIALLWVLLCVACPGRADTVSPVEIRGQTVDFSPAALIAHPGERLVLGMASGAAIALDGEKLGVSTDAGWAFTAPAHPGHYALQVSRTGEPVMTIQLLVTVPADAVENERLNGYRMGPPPPGDPRLPGLYPPPAGFIEVDESLLDLQLTPHFRLRQFLCKQRSDYPKYVVLNESLLVLLEGLLGAVRAKGYAAETFGVISGYRTPWYNQQIGNVPNSRHVYGDAMDLFVDVDGDGNMDDLNGDGQRNRADVDLLADMAEEYMAEQGVLGGVGRYGRTGRHGGFVHVDTRGYRARWGLRRAP